MAAKTKRRVQNKRRGPARRPARSRSDVSGGTLLFMTGGFILVVSMIVALPTVIILMIGMIPTAVAFFVDRHRHKAAAICVAGLNFAGVAPFIATLWHTTNTVGHSLAIVADVYAWLAMYGAAALGWLLYLGLPPLALGIIKIRGEQRIAALRAQQAKLREDWAIEPPSRKPAE